MGIMLEPSNRFKTVNIVNSFVRENLKLQNELFRVQKKLIAVLHKDTMQPKMDNLKVFIFKFLIHIRPKVLRKYSHKSCRPELRLLVKKTTYVLILQI